MSITDVTTTTTGEALPSSGTYSLDPTHTHVGFAVKHFGLAKTRGEFEALAGTVTVAEPLADSSVEVQVETASFSTGDDQRDGHVRSADFLDVENHPHMTYRSTGLENRGDDWVLHGELTVRDVTRPVDLAVEFEGETVDPYGNDRVAFSASTVIDRTDFGMNFNQVLDTGGMVVGNKVTVTLDVEAIRPAGA